MANRIAVWALRLLWLSLPYTAGSLFVEALDGRSSGFGTLAAIGLWVGWGLGLVATLVPHTISLTYLRIVGPASFAASLWALVVADSDPVVELAALVVTGVITVIVMSAPVGAVFVNGTSYGDERRLPLRPPMRLLMGPIPLAWGIAVVGATAGPLLLGAEQWALGALLIVIGFPAAALAVRALHGLGQRWLVFVPAGMVVHDLGALNDPQLFRRADIERLGPALADSRALDLTLAAPGLALELTLVGMVKIVLRPRRGAERAEGVETRALIVTPSQPGAVLREAVRRRIPVG